MVSDKSLPYMSLMLQFAMTKIINYSKKWKIMLNEQKTQAIIVTKKLQLAKAKNIIINEHQIEWVKTAKYLGITIDKNLTWTPHINTRVAMAKTAIAQLINIIGKRSKLSAKLKIQTYLAIIRPIMTYGSTAWCPTCEKNIGKLEVIQNKCLRWAFNAPFFVSNHTLRNNANLPTIREYVKSHILKTYSLMGSTHPNPLVKNIFSKPLIINNKSPRYYALA